MVKRLLFSVALVLAASFSLWADELTVNDGTVTSTKIPADLYNCDGSMQHNQFLVTAEQLSAAAGGSISKMTFYLQSAATKSFSNNWVITLAETEATALTSSYASVAAGTVVYTGTINWQTTTPTIAFSEEYAYSGQNLIVNFYYSGSSTWENKLFLGVSQTGGSVYSTSSYGTVSAFSPKVTFEYTAGGGADCGKPSTPEVSDITTTTANVAWGDGEGAEDFQYLILAAGTTPNWENAAFAGNYSVALENLTPNTQYDFYVRAYCDEETQSSAKKVSFKTECAAIEAATWSESFESATANAMPDCWSVLKEKSSTTYPYVYESSYGAAHTGSKLLYFYGGNSGYGYEAAISPAFAEGYDFSSKMLTFWYKQSATGSSYGALHVGVTDDPSSFGSVTEIAELEQVSTYTKAEILLTGVEGANLVFWVGNDASSYTTYYVDDIELVAAPSCLKAKNIHVDASSIGLNAATLAWVPWVAEESAAAYSLFVKSGNDTLVNWAEVSAEEYTLSNLSSGTNYSLSVKLVSICSASEHSDTVSASVSFATGCEAKTLPYEESFENFNTGFAAGAPTCWNVINCNTGTSSTYPVVYVNNNATYVKTGTKSLFFQSDANTHAIAILPEIDGDLSGAEIKFSYRNEGVSAYNGTLSVGYVTDITDANSFVTLQTCAQTTTMTEITQALATVPADARLAFDYVGGSSNNFYLGIDDIKVREVPSCMPGTNLHGIDSMATTNSVTFGWTPFSAENLNAHVIVKNGEVELFNTNIEDTIFTVTGLQSSKSYALTVDVYTVCDAIESADALHGVLNLATKCATITEFPWSEDFETGVSSLDVQFACWSNEHVSGSGTSLFKITGTSGFGGSKGVYLPDQTSGTITRLTLPEMNIPAANAYIFSIDVNRAYASSYPGEGLRIFADTIELGFISRDYATAGLNVPAESTSGWYTYEFVIPNAGVQHIIIQGENKYGSSTYADNFIVTAAPTCLKPADLKKDTVAPTFAQFSWSPVGEENQWLVMSYDGTTLLDSVVVDDTIYVTSALTPDKYYGNFKVNVSAKCGENEFSKVLSKSFYFTTPATCVIPSAAKVTDITTSSAVLRWTSMAESDSLFVKLGNDMIFNDIVAVDSFLIENLTAATAYSLSIKVQGLCTEDDHSKVLSTSLSFTTDCNAVAALPWSEGFESTTSYSMPLCWSKISTTSYPYVYANTSYYTYSHTGDKCLNFYGGSSSYSEQIAVLPQFGFDLNTVQLHFYHKESSASSSYAKPEVGVMSDPEDASTFVKLAELDLSTTYVLAEVNIVAPAGYNYIAIRVPNTGSYVTSYYFDDFELVEKPSCLKPENVIVSDITTNSAVIRWESEAALGDSVLVKNGEEVLFEGIADADSLLLENLTPATSYSLNVTVQGLCSEEVHSEVAGKVLNFQTECEAIALPYSTSFEASDATLNCWNLASACSYSTTTSRVHEGSRSLQFNQGKTGNTTILPEFAEEVNGKEVSFWYLSEDVSKSGHLVLGYVAGEAFAGLDTLDISTTYQEYAFVLNNIPAGARLAFRYCNGTTDNYWAWIDELKIQDAPTCFKPSAIHGVDSLSTISSGVIAWSAPAEGAAEYKLLVKNGETVLVNNVITADTFYVVNDLNASTAYSLSVSVSSVCGEGDESEVVNGTASFSTLCDIITEFPWSCDFEAFETGKVSEKAPCFSEAKTTGANSWTVSTSGHNSSSKSAYCQYSNSSYGYTYSTMILPEFRFAADKIYTISFFIKGSSYAETDSILVNVSASDGSEHRILNVNTAEESAVNWVEVSAAIHVTGGDRLVSIIYGNNDGYSITLDDITITEAPYLPTDINSVEVSSKVVKFIRQNQVFILRDGVLYNALGQKVK